MEQIEFFTQKYNPAILWSYDTGTILQYKILTLSIKNIRKTFLPSLVMISLRRALQKRMLS